MTDTPTCPLPRPIDQREPAKEFDAMNAMVLDETRGFFQRILGKQAAS